MITKLDPCESTFSVRVECTKNLGDYNSIKVSGYIADIPSSASLDEIHELIDKKVGPVASFLEKRLKAQMRKMAGESAS
jgi:putative sterol carrier protein